MPTKKDRKKKVVRPVSSLKPAVTAGVIRYGRHWGEDYSDLMIELVAFREGLGPDVGGLGKAEHFWKIVAILWPATSRKPFLRHPWAERMAIAACANVFLSVSGCAGSGKTEFFAVWAIINWLCDPLNTKVMVTSTTLKESRRRIWGCIEDYWNSLEDAVRSIGKLVSSYGVIRVSESSGFKASERSGIELIPGEKKREKEAIGKLIGVHNKRVFLIADELPELSLAIMQAAVSNLKGNPYFQAVGLGNPASYFDAHGVFSTPKCGWKKLTVLDYEWETLLGYAIRFDAEQSPNILAGDDTLYPFLPTKVRLEEARAALGAESFGFYRMWKGFWAPEGSESTVFSDADIIYFGADKNSVKWKFPPTPLGALDPGFTNDGDRSVAYAGFLGEEEGSSLTVLLLVEYEVLRDDATDTETPRNFQIATAFKEFCQKRKILPKNAGVDVTGSPAFGDIVAREWSSEIYRMQFGGKSSNKIVGEDRVKAGTRYGNRCTEVWFVARDYMQAGQIRGICPDVAVELTARKFINEGAVVTVEPKRKMKSRTGKSPDIADAALIIVDLARTRHGFKAVRQASQSTRRTQSWKEATSKVHPQRESFGAKKSFRSLVLERSTPRFMMGAGRGLTLIR